MKRTSILLLVVTLLCSAPAYTQNEPIHRPTKKTQTTLVPKSDNSTTSDKSSNNSSATGNSARPSASNRSENQTTTQPSYIYPIEPEKAKPTSGYINGHEWVDLGLSVKWATCNVGASTPSDYGDYYAWGETKTKSYYDSSTSTTDGKAYMKNIEGNPTYDAARANWGGTWRLPTVEEIDELINKCEYIWTTQGGHKGYKVTGPNGKSIFLPATGERYQDGYGLEVNRDAGYWSALPYERNAKYAYCLDFESIYGKFRIIYSGRSNGLSVRPVSE